MYQNIHKKLQAPILGLFFSITFFQAAYADDIIDLYPHEIKSVAMQVIKTDDGMRWYNSRPKEYSLKGQLRVKLPEGTKIFQFNKPGFSKDDLEELRQIYRQMIQNLREGAINRFYEGTEYELKSDNRTTSYLRVTPEGWERSHQSASSMRESYRNVYSCVEPVRLRLHVDDSNTIGHLELLYNTMPCP